MRYSLKEMLFNENNRISSIKNNSQMVYRVSSRIWRKLMNLYRLGSTTRNLNRTDLYGKQKSYLYPENVTYANEI